MSASVTYATLRDQLLRKCKHFTGIQHDACKAGVKYDDVRDSSRGGPYRFPCITLDPNTPASTTCEQRCMRTPEEADAEAEAMEARIRESLRKLSSGTCPHCDAKVSRYVQAGSCVYAEPCGHRQGQGDAAAMNQNVQQGAT